MAFRRREEPSIEDERAALRAQHEALEDLKRELAERVAAVRERELELQRAIADSPAHRPEPTAGPTSLRATAPTVTEAATEEAALAVARREQELDEREKALAAFEAQLVEHQRALEQRVMQEQERLEGRAETDGARGEQASRQQPDEVDEERLQRIEARLAELHEAEKLFLRTRDELAARSEAVAARERLAAQKERELDEREDAAMPWGGGISEVETRLRRLEQQQAAGQAQGFSGGLRRLQQGSTKPQRPA